MSHSEPLLQEPEQDQWADLLLFLLRNNCSPNDQTKNAHANPSGGPDLYCPTQQPRATSQQSTLNGIIWRVKPQLVMPISHISVLLQMHGSSASDPVPCKWAWESNRRWSECSGPYYPWGRTTRSVRLLLSHWASPFHCDHLRRKWVDGTSDSPSLSLCLSNTDVTHTNKNIIVWKDMHCL